MEEIREQIAAYQARQHELMTVMRKSDSHAAKCMKLGLKFDEQYPEEFAEYEAARVEYNANEAKLEQLQADLRDLQETSNIEVVSNEDKTL